MKKFLSFLAAAMFVTVFYYNDQLNIVNRYHAGTLEQDVAEHQTFWGILNVRAKQANMSHFDHFVQCVEQGGTACKATASKR